MPLDPQRVQAVFLAAVNSSDPGERAAMLDRECGGDAELRQRVEILMKAHADSTGLPPVGEGTGAYAPPDFSDQPAAAMLQLGQVFAGRFKLREKLGEGGMGRVYVADQLEPVQRRVALKVLKAGLDSASVLARFEQERQALALMDHPNIAKVFDGGADGHGRPFLVMELVKGIPITKFCDQEHLTPNDRLGLFVPVCQAVQHAHQKGIIHRDLKPSNILIALYDGRPVPKVIDFGVAKATGQRLSENTIYTEAGSIVGTLEYMAPEQAELNNLDIDTRADIYSLGVILYELLTGGPPFSRKQLKGAAFTEMLRMIREVEPHKPSTRLSSSAELPSIAANRKLEPKKLTKLVHGELDWIVMKCLEKERGRRYDTATGLAGDVQRYLAQEPVLAGPPGAGYRLRKFVRRNKRPVLAGVVILLLLVGGVVGTSIGLVRALTAEALASDRLTEVQQAVEATHEALRATKQAKDNTERALKASEDAHQQTESARRRTRAALDTLTEDIIEQVMGRQARLREQEKAFLRKVQNFYEDFAESQGNTERARRDRADGLFQVARIRRRLGELADAEPPTRESLALRKQLAADFPADPGYRQDVATSHNHLAILLSLTGRLKEAEEAHREAVAVRKKLVAEVPAERMYRLDLATSHQNLGVLLTELGRSSEADTAYLEAAGVWQKLVDDFPAEPGYRRSLAMTCYNRGALLSETGRMAEAEAANRQSLAIYRSLTVGSSTSPDLARELAHSLTNLGQVLYHTGKSKEAESTWREALTIQKKLAADYPAVPGYRQDLARNLINLGAVLDRKGVRTEAEAAQRDALAIYRGLTADLPTVTAYRREQATCLGNLASSMMDSGRLPEAEELFRESLALREKLVADFPKVPDAKNDLAFTLVNLAKLKILMKEPAAAKERLDQARPHQQAALQANPQGRAYRELFRNNLWYTAEALVGMGDHVAALTTADEMIRFGFDPSRDAYGGACLAARCIGLAQADTKLAEPKREELALAYADRAMTLLAQSAAAGFKDANVLKKEKALDGLRGRMDFQKLVQELESKAKP